MQGFKQTVGAAPVQILAVVDPQVSFSCLVSDTGVSAGTDGKKVVKADTPVGVLLHDVDVTDGKNNGTCLVFGFVNLERLDETTAALITSKVKTALNGKVTFIK